MVTSTHAPVQQMQKMELAWGFGRTTGVDLPQESAGTVPTRAWLYRFYTQHKKLWCRQANQYGSYAQQIAYQDCHYGNVWEPGQAVDAAIGQGYVTVTPTPAGQRLRRPGQRRHAVQPARRRRAGPAGRPAGAAHRHRRSSVICRSLSHCLAYIRNALADVVTQGTAAPAFSGFPLRKVCVAGKTGTAQVAGKLRDIGLRVVRAVRSPSVRRRHDDPCLRLRRRRLGARGAADLGRHLRPRRPPGCPAWRQSLPESRQPRVTSGSPAAMTAGRNG